MDANPEVGIEAVEGLPLIREVKDHAASNDLNERVGWIPPKHNKAHRPLFDGKSELPPSVREAVRAFILAGAARRARGQTTEHNSMLIHVTRFTDVQHQVYIQVEAELSSIVARLRRGDGNAPQKILKELKKLWEDDFEDTSRKVNDPELLVMGCSEIEPHLLEFASSVQIKQVNGSALDVLDYERHKARPA